MQVLQELKLIKKLILLSKKDEPESELIAKINILKNNGDINNIIIFGKEIKIPDKDIKEFYDYLIKNIEYIILTLEIKGKLKKIDSELTKFEKLHKKHAETKKFVQEKQDEISDLRKQLIDSKNQVDNIFLDKAMEATLEIAGIKETETALILLSIDTIEEKLKKINQRKLVSFIEGN